MYSKMNSKKRRLASRSARSRVKKEKSTNTLNSNSATAAMDVDIHTDKSTATSKHNQTRKRKRSASRGSKSKSRSSSSSPLRKKRRTKSRVKTPISENVPYIIYHENKIDDPTLVSDSYRPIIIINIPLFSGVANTAYYKTSGRSNDRFKGLYSDTWIPTAGLIENSGYTKKNGEILTYGFILKMSTISNITEKKTYKWIYDLIIDYFDNITPDIYKTTLDILKPTQSSINSYYNDVRQYLINTTEDNLNFFETLFNEYKDIHELLHNYFLNKEQIFISAQLGGGYWEKNTRFCNFIKGLSFSDKIISVAENAKPTISTIIVPTEGTTGHNTQEVIDFLKVNNAEYTTDEIEEKIASLELVPYSFYINSLFSILLQVKNTRKALARIKK